MMKLGILAYVPPPKFGCAQVFLENVLQYTTVEELVLYSDYPYTEKQFFRNSKGEPIMLPPEDAAHHARYNNFGQKRPAAMSNMAWHIGLRVAHIIGFTHILYLESDCRVQGNGWDKRIWQDFFDQPFPIAAGGTVSTFNPVNGGAEYYTAWQKKMIQLWNNTSFPITVYGAPPSPGNLEKGIPPDPRTPTTFVNGACGVYSMQWMKEFFDLKNLIACAQGKAWDYVIGEKLYERFGILALDLVGQLNSVYSGFGDELNSEANRLQMLHDGIVSAVHQVKSNAK